MLTIRAEQMQALRADVGRRFRRRLGAYLSRQWPERTAAVGRERLAALVETGLEGAAGHGIVTQAAACRYVEYLLLFGEDFPSRPWVAGILGRDDLGGPEKIARIDGHVLFAEVGEDAT